MLKRTEIHFVCILNHQIITNREEEPVKAGRIYFSLPFEYAFHCGGGKNLRHLVTLPP